MSTFRLQQHLNDLLKHAGQERLTQEQVNSLVASAAEKPGIVTQTQLQRAIKQLSQKAKDPRIVQKKYDELRRKDLTTNLDRLVVLLSRQLTAGTYHSTSSIDDKPRSTVDVSGVRELKEALRRETGEPLPEAVPPQTLSERLQEAAGTRAPKPPPVPDWVTGRPYMTRGLINEPDRASAPRPTLAPLGDLPLSAQEATVIEEVLSCLAGVDGNYITISQGVCRMDSSIDPGLQEIVRQISPLFAQFATVMAFTEETKFAPGQVVQALGAALRSQIKHYLVLIAQLETEHMRREVTAQRLFFYLQPSMRTMEILATIADQIYQGCLQSGQILSLLHERCLSGDQRTQQLCLHLIHAASQPYMLTLDSWIHRGTIADPYHEFLVEDNELTRRERLSADYSDDYWEKRYTVAPHKIPAFLTKVADKLLRAGKYLNVVRECDGSISCPSAQSLVYSPRERHYVDAIDKAYDYSSKTLLRLLIDGKDLMGRLRSVKHYYMMDQGDFVVQFMDLCEPELQKNIDDIVPTRLENLLDMALRTSVANGDPYKDDLRPELLGYDLMTQMMRILSIETYEEKEHWYPAERLSITGLEAFTFGSVVAWPVSLVLNRKALACYQMIFRHLFYCKHVERRLCRLWLCTKVVKGFSADDAGGYAPAFALRQRMLSSVQNLLYYMTIEVLEPSWQAFLAKMQQVTNVDEVLSLHTDLLNGCMRDCMLTRPELLRTVSSLLAICVRFVNFMQSPEVLEASDSATFENTISDIDTQFTTILLTLLDSVSDFGLENYNAKLVSILYRLDFNGFYTERLEQRANERLSNAEPSESQENLPPPS